jgi:hypothetical protein
MVGEGAELASSARDGTIAHIRPAMKKELYFSNLAGWSAAHAGTNAPYSTYHEIIALR